MSEAGNRRQYFRIDDEVDLYYRKISSEEAPGRSHVTENVLTDEALPQILAATSRDMHALLQHIETAQPLVAEYLQLLNYKVDMLAESVMQRQSSDTKYIPRLVNLSASGLAFGSDQAMQYGDCLELRILLPASRALIATSGRVVQCRPNPVADPQHPYLVSVVYLNMSEENREVLVKHVIKRQTEQLRAQRPSG